MLVGINTFQNTNPPKRWYLCYFWWVHLNLFHSPSLSTPEPPNIRHLNFGASSSSVAGRGGHDVMLSMGAAIVACQRVNIAATTPVSAPTHHRTARSNTSQHGDGGQHGCVSRPLHQGMVASTSTVLANPSTTTMN